MQNADVGRVTKCLIDYAVAFGQSNQCGELLFAGVSIQIEVQTNLLKADRHVFRNAEGAAKIQIALCSNRGVAQWNAKSGRDCVQRDTCASYQRLEQYIGGAGTASITAGRRVKTCFNARFSRFDFACDIFTDTSLRVESNETGLRTLSVLRLQRRL